MRHRYQSKKLYTFLFGFLSAACFVCCEPTQQLDDEGFRQLMQNVAIGWSTQNTPLALSSFHEDAIYMQPPDVQYYRGHRQLRPYFDALDQKYQMQFHQLWFDPVSQSGAGEFTFSYQRDTSDVGVVVTQVEGGKIVFWREYLTKGPTDFHQFIDTTNKHWQWHIGNYP